MHLLEWGVWIFFCNNMNCVKNATFSGYTYIAVVAADVSWTSFTLSTGINTVQCRTAGCSVWASHPNFYSVCQLFLTAQAELYALAGSCTFISRIDTQALVKVGHLAFGGLSGTFQSLSGSFTIWLATHAKSGLWVTGKKSQSLSWESFNNHKNWGSDFYELAYVSERGGMDSLVYI